VRPPTGVLFASDSTLRERALLVVSARGRGELAPPRLDGVALDGAPFAATVGPTLLDLGLTVACCCCTLPGTLLVGRGGTPYGLACDAVPLLSLLPVITGSADRARRPSPLVEAALDRA
jgi:hypothetical protein